MKLNPDCVRDILLCVENIPNVKYVMTFDRQSIAEDFPKYSYDEIVYHLRQCELCGFFYKASHNLEGDYTVYDLTPSGHEFLANIREDNLWNHIKTISSQVGSKSIFVLTQIASGVVTAIIKNQLGI